MSLSNRTIYENVDISKIYNTKLFSSLCIPSPSHSYSLCIEYMKKWFLDKFPNNSDGQEYFKSVYVDGKHIFDDFKSFSKKEMIKRLKPALAIMPQIDESFDNEKQNLYLGGLDLYLSRCGYKDAFFRDMSKQLFIAVTMELMLMNFTFKIKVSTKAQAQALIKYMKLAFRVGATQGKYIDMDFHIPYDLMLQVAKDTGFSTKKDSSGQTVVTDIIGFMGYLNRNSQVPFLYKYRSINGHNEFFIRVDNAYVHISTPEINVDDGEREEQILTNFIVEMTSTVRFPCPKFYSYYSHTEHINISKSNIDSTISSVSINLTPIPLLNSKGWNQFMSTDYIQQDRNTIAQFKFNELLGDLRVVIDHTKEMFLSPAKFIDIKLYNGHNEVDIDIDWQEFEIKSKTALEDTHSHLVFYIDTEYMNNQIINLKEYDKGRLK